MALGSYKELEVWKLSMGLILDIYNLAARLRDDEKYGLRTQMCRAIWSIPRNIAEGYGRGTRRDYAHFVTMARGSAMELDTIMEVLIELKYFRREELKSVWQRLDQLCRMLTRLR